MPAFFETLTKKLHRQDQALSTHGLDLTDLRGRLTSLFRIARVTALNPLTVRFGDGAEAKPDYSLVEAASLAVDDRLLLARFETNIVVLGKIWAL